MPNDFILQTNHLWGQFKEFPFVSYLPRKGGRVAVRDPAENANDYKSMGHIFDPRVMYRDNSGSLFFEVLSLYVTALSDEKNANKGNYSIIDRVWLTETTKRGRRLFEFKVQYMRAGKLGNLRTLVLDEQTGFNPVEYITKSAKGKLTSKWTWRYKQEGSIFIPEQFRMTEHSGATEELVAERTVSYVESSFEPVTSETFELGYLGLKSGERFVDHIENKLQIWDDGELVSPDDYRPPPFQPEARSWRWTLNLFVLGVLIAVYAYSRSRSD